eukprot:m.32741 g.32741  ORF g.32741 m.32741 type:complete len:178 (+) comp9551_c0_seq2:344-877(+)
MLWVGRGEVGVVAVDIHFSGTSHAVIVVERVVFVAVTSLYTSTLAIIEGGCHSALRFTTYCTYLATVHTSSHVWYPGVMVLSSERLNQWAAESWRLFSNHQYFDAQGLFISIMFSFPAILNLLLLVILWLKETADLLVRAKTEQAKRKIKASTKSKSQSSCTARPDSTKAVKATKAD